jgi:hypothetical protein
MLTLISSNYSYLKTGRYLASAADSSGMARLCAKYANPLQKSDIGGKVERSMEPINT